MNVFISLGKFSEVPLLGPVAVLCLVFKKLPNIFPERLYHFIFLLHPCWHLVVLYFIVAILRAV